MTDVNFDDALKARSVEDEYEIVHGTPCTCGGKMTVKGQKLLREGTAQKPYDLLDTQCLQCGKAQQFLFDISAFFGKNQLAKSPAAEPQIDGPTPESRRWAFKLCIGIVIFAATLSIWPFRAYGSEQSIRAGYILMGIFGVFAFLIHRRIKADAALAAGSSIDAQRQVMAEIDGGTLDNLEATLARHGLTLNWGPSDPETALVGGMAKASLSLGCGYLEKNEPVRAIESFSRAIKLLETKKPEQFRDVLAALYCLRAQAHEKVKQTAEALADYEQALKHAPTHELAAAGVTRLKG